MDACGVIVSNEIFVLCALAGFLTAAIIALAYMIGNLLSNPKVTLWAKTESVQLFISIASVFIIIEVTNVFCAIDISALSGITGLTTTLTSTNLFDAADAYLTATAAYTHDVLTIERYYLKGFDLLLGRSRWACADSIFGVQLCLFGGSGPSHAPYAWISSLSGAFHIAYQSVLFSYLFSLTSLFLLQYINHGLVLLFLPLGILFRSLPFFRSLGSLFIALVLAFMIVYPTVLSIFSLASDAFITGPNAYISDSLKCFIDPGEEHLESLVDDPMVGMFEPEFYDAEPDEFQVDFVFPESGLSCIYGWNGMMAKTGLMLAAKGFLAGTFLPTLALLATIASVKYLSAQLGEEIDLSRIVQLI